MPHYIAPARKAQQAIRIVTVLVFMLWTLSSTASPRVITPTGNTAREQFGADRLRAAVSTLPGDEVILLSQRGDPLLRSYDKQLPIFLADAKEAFLLRRIGSTIIASGSDASGTLYAALELASRIKTLHALPEEIDYQDHPLLKLRGYALGMQKPEITYEDAEYDYLYTSKDFPFFYDKNYWTKYLDYLVENRINTLYLWNGHPFTSLLKLPRYPEAQELPTAQLEQNIAMFHWLTQEADRRCIWVLQGFYNIHLSHAFARAHNVPYHLSAPTPLSSDYTRYAISEFIREYPSVGIFMTLGEAMGPHYSPEWLTKTIIPGVQDGVAELSKQTGHPVPEPPIIVRAHATDIEAVMPAAAPLYSNIDTMWKWNGESLTWTNIRGPVEDRFNKLVAGSKTTIVNIHLLSNLEPFRWGDPDFIRQTILNFQRIGIGGLHLYPLRYWDWPVSADNTLPRLQQIDRDWIWYESWARYAWNPNRSPEAERIYWIGRFAERFGDATAAEHLLNAYQLTGICSPKLLPRIGITEGNRQVFSLGMTMPQLIDAARFSPAETLWTGDAPPGERLTDFVSNEMKHQPHQGETPIGVAAEVAASSAKAVIEAQAAAPGITKHEAEHKRIVNDMQSIAALMAFYNAKTQAAALVMQYGYNHDLTKLTSAEILLTQSVKDFRTIVALTDTTYLNAAAMHTSQRQIPVRGGPATEHFRDLLPVYERELTVFRSRLKVLNTAGQPSARRSNPAPLPQVSFTLDAGAGEAFTVTAGQSLYADTTSSSITSVIPELNGLRGIRVSSKQTEPLHFTLSAPAQILVGFFKSSSRSALNVSPATEQWNILLPNAITPSGKNALPVTVWTRPLSAGRNDLDLGKGAYIVLGFVPESVHVTPHFDSAANGTDGPTNLDWLFED